MRRCGFPDAGGHLFSGPDRCRWHSLGSAPGDTAACAFDEHVVNGRDVQREQLRHGQTADYRKAEWSTRLRTSAPAECDWERAHQRRHRRHHDGTEPDEAGFMDGLDRLLAFVTLRLYG